MPVRVIGNASPAVTHRNVVGITTVATTGRQHYRHHKLAGHYDRRRHCKLPTWCTCDNVLLVSASVAASTSTASTAPSLSVIEMALSYDTTSLTPAGAAPDLRPLRLLLPLSGLINLRLEKEKGARYIMGAKIVQIIMGKRGMQMCK